MVTGFAGRLGTATATFVANMKPFLGPLAQGVAAMNAFNKTSATVGIGFDDIARKSAVAGAAIGAGLGLAAKSFIGFEQGVANIGAVSDATSVQLKDLEALALDLGRTTTFGATQATGAMEELAKAGLSVEDILNGAARGATSLAAAAGGGLADAATIIATSLNAFQLSGADAEHVADVFAAAANKSATSIDALALGLAQSSNLANQFGISLEENVAALALFADRGLKGSDAGTSFRTMLLSMLDPTDEQAGLMKELSISFFDATGNFIGLGKTAELLRNRLAGLTNEERNTALAVLFGSDAVRAASILYSAGEAGIVDYTRAVNDNGAAARQAAARLDTTAGSLLKLRRASETAAIEFGRNLAPTIRALAEALTALVAGVSRLPQGLQEFIATNAALAAGLLLVVAAGTKAISIGTSMARTWGSLAKAFGTAQANCAASAACLTATGKAASGAVPPTTSLIGNLKQLAKFSAAAIIVTIGTELAIDAVRNAPSAHSSQLEQVGVEIADIIGKGIRKASDDKFGQSIEDGVDEAIANMEGRDLSVEIGFNIAQKEDTFDKIFREALPFGAGEIVPDEWIPDVDHATDEIVELGVSVEHVQNVADTMGLSFVEALDLIARQANVTTPALEEWRKQQEEAAKATTLANAETRAQADILSASASAQAATAQATANIVAENEKAAQSFEALQRAAIAAFSGISPDAGEDLDKEVARVNDAVNGFVAGALEDLGARTNRLDLSHPFEFLQRQIQPTSNTVAALTAKLGRMDILDLSKSQQAALKLGSALERTIQKIDDVDAAIANNEDDMSMWQGRIDLVERTFGSAENTMDDFQQQLAEGTITQEEFNDAVTSGEAHEAFADLQELVDTGRISQEQANEAKEDGIWLIERSEGALLDERAEQVKNISALRDLVELRDQQNGEIKELDKNSRAMLAAMQDETAQQQLQIVQTLAYLAALGLIPPEKVTEFITNAAAENPIVAELFNLIGLLPDETKTEIDADGKPARDEVDNTLDWIERRVAEGPDKPIKPEVDTDEALDDFDTLDDRVKIFQTYDGTTVTISAETEADAIEAANKNAALLDGKNVEVVITTEDSQYKTTLAEIRGDTIDPKVVDITGNTQPLEDAVKDATDNATIGDPFSGGSPGGGATATLPPATQPVAADTAPALTQVAALRTEIENPAAGPPKLPVAADVSNVAPGDLTAQGTATGESFSKAFIDAASLASSGLGTVFQAMIDASIGAAPALAGGGAAAADAFTLGMLNQLNSNQSLVYDAAYQLALRVYQATIDALQIGSPSKLSREALRFYVQGAILGINEQTPAAADAARTSANRISGSFIGGLGDTRIDPFVVGGVGASLEQRGIDAFQPLPARGGGTTVIHNHNGDINVPVVSAQDPETVGRVVYDKLNNEWDRRESARG